MCRKLDHIPKQSDVKHLLFLSVFLFAEEFHKECKSPPSVQPSINIQQSLWTGNASILWRVMLSTALNSLCVLLFLSLVHTSLALVYVCQVKQYPCLTVSWMLALMCSSHWAPCHFISAAANEKKAQLPAGFSSGGPWPQQPFSL